MMRIPLYLNQKHTSNMKRPISVLTLLLFTVIVTFAQRGSLSVEEVFEATSQIEGFQEENVYDYFQFPKSLGKPTMIIHGNAEPRDTVLDYLRQLPEGSMVYNDTDERGRFDRWFIDQVNGSLLYVHIGINGNDSVLILFKGGKRKDIDKFISKITAERQE